MLGPVIFSLFCRSFYGFVEAKSHLRTLEETNSRQAVDVASELSIMKVRQCDEKKPSSAMETMKQQNQTLFNSYDSPHLFLTASE